MEGVASCSTAMAKQVARKKKKHKLQNSPIVKAGKPFNKTKGKVNSSQFPAGGMKHSQKKLAKKRKNSDGSEGAKRKKVKASEVNTRAIVDTAPGQQGKDGEAEDVAESIDSGCVADGPSVVADGKTDWPQVSSLLCEAHIVLYCHFCLLISIFSI